MDRRGFLGRLLAATTAFTAAATGGGRLALAAGQSAAAAPSTVRKTPGVCITADTSRFEQAIGDAGRQVVELLRQCRVTSMEWTSSVGDLKRYRAVFEQSDATPTHLDAEAWKIIEQGYLTSVSVSSTADEVDVFAIGDPPSIESIQPVEVRHTVAAEFVVRG